MKSPCIRMCTLNEKDMCIGCGRMLNEITSWTSYSEQKHTELMNNCKNRLSALGKQESLLVQARKTQVDNS